MVYLSKDSPGTNLVRRRVTSFIGQNLLTPDYASIRSKVRQSSGIECYVTNYRAPVMTSPTVRTSRLMTHAVDITTKL